MKARNPLLFAELFPEDRRSRHTFLSDGRTQPGMFIYHVSIIDYLRKWDISTMAEHYTKATFRDRHQISCVPPEKYATRFLNFMQSQVIINQEHWDGMRKEISLHESMAKLSRKHGSVHQQRTKFYNRQT